MIIPGINILGDGIGGCPVDLILFADLRHLGAHGRRLRIDVEDRVFAAGCKCLYIIHFLLVIAVVLHQYKLRTGVCVNKLLNAFHQFHIIGIVQSPDRQADQQLVSLFAALVSLVIGISRSIRATTAQHGKRHGQRQKHH